MTYTKLRPHIWGNKNEFKGKGGSLAPSALCAGTTEGTCSEIPYISIFTQSQLQKEAFYLFTRSGLTPFRPQLLR
jgi:hypothetical protein